MVSKGIVTKIIDENLAEVEVTRQSACGENCASCKGCDKPTFKAISLAKNPINAKVGQSVNLKNQSQIILKGAVFVYILPIVLFFAFYTIGISFIKIESICNILGVVGFGFGIYIAGMYSKKTQSNITLEIFE